MRNFTKAVLALVAVGGVLAWGALARQAAVSAQSNPPNVLVAWVAESGDDERLYYSILDSNGDTVVQDRIGLSGKASEVTFRICGIHWTGKKWVVIVDDGERLSERGLIKVVIAPDGTSGWFGISSTFDFISDVTTHQSDGNGRTGGCLGPQP